METYNGGITVYIPEDGDSDYDTGSTSHRQAMVNIADHDHTGSGSGTQIPTGGIADLAVTAAKIADSTITTGKLAAQTGIAVVANNVYLKWRNQADSADVNVAKLNTSNNLELDPKCAKLVMTGNTYILFRNNADAANVNGIKLNTNDDLELDPELAVIRLKSNTFLTGRNNADNAYINLLKVDTSDDLSIGADLVPDTDSTHDLGKSGAEWQDLYVDNIKTGANTVIAVDASGSFTTPTQCMFRAELNTTLSNVTGNNTMYTVIFDTENYDLNSDFNLGTSTFTAPLTGHYHFDFILRVDGMTGAGSDFLMRINVNAGSTLYEMSEDTSTSAPTNMSGSISTDIPLTAGDTVVFQVRGQGEAGDVWDLPGIAAGRRFCYVSGRLIG